MNIKILCSSILIGLAGISQAQEFNMVVNKSKNNYDIIEILDTVISEWENTGTIHNCTPTLDPNDYYNGMTFTQIDDCDQKQEQTTTTAKKINGELQETTTIEERIITVQNEYDLNGLFIASSCKDILDSHGSIGDDYYQIRTDSANRSVFCDMTTDGGGWTIVADQNLYVEGYPNANAGIPNNDPNDIKNTRLTRWPSYTEYAIKSVIDLHGAPYDASVNDEFRKFNTGSFGEVEVDMISFLLDKNDYQNGRAKNEYVTHNGVAWGDSHSHPNYYGYYWFGKSGMTYNHWGQADVWGHIVNSDLFRISSNQTGYARTAGCGAAWANNACREAKSAWVNRNTIKQKAVLMVR